MSLFSKHGSIFTYLKEARALLLVALPVMFSQISIAAMGFIDSVMSGQVSPTDLAGVAMGYNLWFPIFISLTGVYMVVVPIISRLRGAKLWDEISLVITDAFLLCMFVMAICFVLLSFTDDWLEFLNLEPGMLYVSKGYLGAIMWGIPALFLYSLIKFVMEGLSLLKPIMIISFCGLLLNIFLNYGLIYGNFGFPELGGIGSGWATTFVYYFMLIALFCVTFKTPLIKKMHIFNQRVSINKKRLGKMLALGLPVGGALFVEVSLFAMMSLLAAGFGANVVAAHQAALNLSSMVFMVPMSIAAATTIRVGYALGSGDSSRAQSISQLALLIALAFAIFSAIIMLVFSEPLMSMYSNNSEVIAIAVGLLIYAVMFQFSDGIQVIAIGALRAYKDTFAPMLVTVMAYWVVGLPLGYILSMTYIVNDTLSIDGLWFGVVVGLTTAALMLFMRLRYVVNRNEI